MRSSCDASARNRRSRSSLASRSANASSIWSSIAFSASPRRPTSVRSVGRADAAREVAGGDRVRGLADPLERPQADAAPATRRARASSEQHAGDHERLDEQQPVERLRRPR